MIVDVGQPVRPGNLDLEMVVSARGADRSAALGAIARLASVHRAHSVVRGPIDRLAFVGCRAPCSLALTSHRSIIRYGGHGPT